MLPKRSDMEKNMNKRGISRLSVQFFRSHGAENLRKGALL